MQLTRGRSLARRPSRLPPPKEGRRHAGRIPLAPLARRERGARRAALPLAREACAQLIGEDVGQTERVLLFPVVLTSLRLKNFRGFEDHVLPLRPITLVVGRNNAGKSSVVEALRLISLVTTRLRGLGFHEGPEWGGITRREVGVRPSLKGLEINFSSFFHRYGDPPALIEASFENHPALRIYVGGEDRVHAVVLDPKGQPVRGKATAVKLGLPMVEILPQVAPLEPNEVVLNDEYVRRAASSNLASRHFRNQLRIYPDHFERLSRLVEETWPGLRIVELRDGRGYPGDELALTVQDRDFVAEAATMGHGLQMWLQTMWFLARVGSDACVILDEPDVYMHADLQRRLVRHLKAGHQQVVIATHSVEMMSEVEPEDILVVDRRGDLKDEVFDAMAAELLLENRAAGAPGANKEARRLLAERWRTKAGRLATVSGKEVLARLSQWSQSQFGASLSASVIMRHLRTEDVPEELKAVISAVERGSEIDWQH
jgi:predicted ATPase